MNVRDDLAPKVKVSLIKVLCIQSVQWHQILLIFRFCEPGANVYSS